MNKQLIIIPLISAILSACDDVTDSHRFDGVSGNVKLTHLCN
jgi:hypothetical protein